MSTQTESPFLVQVAKDHLSATIAAREDAQLAKVAPGEISAALKAAKVAVDDAVTRRITEYLEILQNPESDSREEFVIAEGRATTEGTDAKFTWDDSFDKQAAAWSEDEGVDYYNISSITTVEEGAHLGWITPVKPGAAGVDVHGNSLTPKHRPQEITLKQGVKLGDDGKSVIATTAGRVVFENNELRISEVVEIGGDVDFETGNLDLATDAVVRGTVRDLFCVKTKKSLTVWGTIEAAEVEAVGNVTVRGGILNRAKGKVIAGGEIAAKFCDEADLHAKGDILIGKEVMNSHVHTEGKLLVARGSIIGGEVFARHGVEAATLGSEAGVPTTIAVGTHPDEFRQIEETGKENEKRRAAMEKIRQAVGPLMAQLKRLTGAQREQATELMYQADSIEAEIKKSEEEVAAILASTSDEDKPYVLVNSMIHQRVSVSIGDRVYTFQEESKGPVKIERRKIKNYTALVLVNQLTGSVRELPARKLELALEKSTPA